MIISGQAVPVQFRWNRRARRYILRVQPGGEVTVTVPRTGTLREAFAFAQRQRDWIERQRRKPALQPIPPAVWQAGSVIFFRGEPVLLTREEAPAGGRVRFSDQTVPVPAATDNLRPAIERHCWRLASTELVQRTLEMAAGHQVEIRRIHVRNQRSRWGSCSARGTISLNWRLIQMPLAVRDYLILHELMHRREMNHSPRFWGWVAAVCPGYAQAEAWLRQHGRSLR